MAYVCCACTRLLQPNGWFLKCVRLRKKALCLIEFSLNWYREDKLDTMRKCCDENNTTSQLRIGQIALWRSCWMLLAKSSILPLLLDLCPQLRCDRKWKSHTHTHESTVSVKIWQNRFPFSQDSIRATHTKRQTSLIDGTQSRWNGLNWLRPSVSRTQFRVYI